MKCFYKGLLNEFEQRRFTNDYLLPVQDHQLKVKDFGRIWVVDSNFYRQFAVKQPCKFNKFGPSIHW